MTAVWPVSLPQAPESSGFELLLPDNVARTSTDANIAKQRRIAAWGREGMVAPFLVNQDQLTTFIDFYKTTLKSGTLVFEWTHPYRQVLGEYRIIDKPRVEGYSYGDWYRIVIVLEHVRDLS